MAIPENASKLGYLTPGGSVSSGIRRVVAELANAQAELGHRTLVHLTGPDSFDEAPEAAAGNPVVVRSSLTGPRAFGLSLAAERWVDSPGAADLSLLHQHGIWLANSRVTRLWRAKYARPTVVTPHGSLEAVPLSYSPWKKALALAAYERRNLHDASCLHATAEQEVQSFRDFGLRNPVAVIPNGISSGWMQSTGDGNRFRSTQSIPADARIMLYMSRIHPKKNLLGLVEAVSRLRGDLRGWHLAIGGMVEDSAYGARVKRAVAENELSAHVHWLPELRGQAKRDAFAAAELLLLPTLSDNFAIVVGEALAVGVPVLTTEGALPWVLLREHECGWWVPHGEQALVSGLREAMHTSPETLRAMGQNGRALIESRFRWRCIASRFIQLYDWLLDRAERPAFVVTG